MASDNEVMECTPECNMNCNMGIDNDDDIIDEQFLNAKTSIIALKSALNKLQQDLKIIERNVSRRQNKVKRERKKRSERKPKKLSGFALPAKISDELSEFMGRDNNEPIARTDVTRYIIKYVKDNKLQCEENGQNINPDKKLRKLLAVQDEDKLTYFNLQKFMNRHFHKG